MPRNPDAVSRLHDLLSDPPAGGLDPHTGEPLADRFDPDAPGARASLERMLAAPPLAGPPSRQPHPQRTAVRGLALTGAASCAAVAAVALWPSVGGSPDVIARAAAALDQPGTILHFKANVYWHDSPTPINADPSHTLGQTIEEWQSPGARQLHVVESGPENPGGDEYAENWDAKTAEGYNGELNQLIDLTDPSFFDPARRSPAGTNPATLLGLGGQDVTDDLESLVQEAEGGVQNIHVAGQTTIRGSSVYELRIDYTVPVVADPSGATITNPTGLPTTPVRLSTLVYVDSQTFLPVRIVDLGPPAPAVGPGAVVERVTDYVLAERLPDTPQNQGLLGLSPHPGATEVAGPTASSSGLARVRVKGADRAGSSGLARVRVKGARAAG
jgi:hypothetical protein